MWETMNINNSLTYRCDVFIRYKIGPSNGLSSVTLYQKNGQLIGLELGYKKSFAMQELYILTGLDAAADQYLEQAYPIDQVSRVDSDYLESLKKKFW
jgi:hypothetical protein